MQHLQRGSADGRMTGSRDGCTANGTGGVLPAEVPGRGRDGMGWEAGACLSARVSATWAGGRLCGRAGAENDASSGVKGPSPDSAVVVVSYLLCTSGLGCAGELSRGAGRGWAGRRRPHNCGLEATTSGSEQGRAGHRKGQRQSRTDWIERLSARAVSCFRGAPSTGQSRLAAACSGGG